MQGPVSPQKVCDEKETKKEKQCAHKNVIDRRKHQRFLRYQRYYFSKEVVNVCQGVVSAQTGATRLAMAGT